MWTGLVAEAASQIDKPDARVAEGGNALGRVVGAGVPHDYELPVAERRIAQALNCVPQRLASVVGRDNNGNGWSRCRFGGHGITLHDMDSRVVREALGPRRPACQTRSRQRLVCREHIGKRSCLAVLV